MSRLGTILMAVALVSALLAVPFGVSAVAADEPNTSVAPGERLAGVVGIQQAAVAGDLSERTYETRLEGADTDDERAEIVAERRAEIERRLAGHESELAELRAAREAGNISEGTYRARVATLAAEKGSTERAAERASEAARRLPADVREARGISVESLQELRNNASELGGPETAAIAREIGGPDANRPAVGPREGGSNERGPGAPTPDRNASSQPMPTSDERPAEPGERLGESGEGPIDERSVESHGRQADERPAQSSEPQTNDGQSTSAGGDDSTAGPSDHSTRQRGDSDDTTRQNTGTPGGSAEPSDRQGGPATGTDNPGSNSDGPADR